MMYENDRQNKNVYGSGYPTYYNFLPPTPTLNFFFILVKLKKKKKMEGKACILKDIFLWHEPYCTQKDQNFI